MMGLKFIAIAKAASRTYCSTAAQLAQKGFRNETKKKRNYPTNSEPRIKSTAEQKFVLNRVPHGFSVFITGSAGTGKTALIKQIIKLLRKVHGKSRVFVTASTGVAACVLGGQTLHSFAGIGFPTCDRVTLLERVLLDRRACWRWSKVGALIIDEISMVDANMFENLEYIARQVRGSNKVWGGIQLIVSGDFFQLPPIIDEKTSSTKEFAFEADCWGTSFHFEVELTKVFRQQDAQLIKLLQGIRRGENGPEDLQLLEQSCSMTEPDPLMVRLYPRIKDVNKVNEERLKSLDEELVTYEAIDNCTHPWKRQFNQGTAPDQLVLCRGARVMLIKNLNIWRNLVNGATGTVTGFVVPKVSGAAGTNSFVNTGNIVVTNPIVDLLVPVVKFDSGLEIVIEPETWVIMEGDLVVARRKQIPLVLAWAQSIHKCQGLTLDRLHTDLSQAFGYGMVYVALSRVKSLEGLHLAGFSPSKIKAHPKVLQFYKRLAIEQGREAGKDDGLDKTSNGEENYHFSV